MNTSTLCPIKGVDSYKRYRVLQRDVKTTTQQLHESKASICLGISPLLNRRAITSFCKSQPRYNDFIVQTFFAG